MRFFRIKIEGKDKKKLKELAIQVCADAKYPFNWVEQPSIQKFIQFYGHLCLKYKCIPDPVIIFPCRQTISNGVKKEAQNIREYIKKHVIPEFLAERTHFTIDFATNGSVFFFVFVFLYFFFFFFFFYVYSMTGFAFAPLVLHHWNYELGCPYLNSSVLCVINVNDLLLKKSQIEYDKKVEEHNRVLLLQ